MGFRKESLQHKFLARDLLLQEKRSRPGPARAAQAPKKPKSRLRNATTFVKRHFLTTGDNRKTSPGGGVRGGVNPPRRGLRGFILLSLTRSEQLERSKPRSQGDGGILVLTRGLNRIFLCLQERLIGDFGAYKRA